MLRVPPPSDTEYWQRVTRMAEALNSDGCTGVRDYFLPCCHLHDIIWRTGYDPDGNPRTPEEGNILFRKCIQSRSKLGRFSPMAWIRYWAVSLVSKFRRPTPTHPLPA